MESTHISTSIKTGKSLLVVLLVLLVSQFSGTAQEKKYTPTDYIAMYKDLAVIEMRRTGIPASITLAQGLLESSNGNSKLAREANNHFGIKCKKDWDGKTMLLDDDKPQECFRVYEKAEESYYDHSEFIVSGNRYAFLFKLDPKDYKGWANGLKEAGYATNPHYPELLINSIETYNLFELDEGKPMDTSGSMVVERAARYADTTKDFAFNGLPACVVRVGDSIESIARAHKMMPSLLRKYNDLCDWDKPEPGTVLYLKPKARIGTQQYYVVKNGDGMYMVSQLFRIKLKQLYKKNKMQCGMQPVPGEKIYLQSSRDSAPQILPAAGAIIPRRKEGINVHKSTAHKDTGFRPDIIIYKKLNLPEIDTTLPVRVDSTLKTINKNINERARAPRILYDTMAKLPAGYKAPEDTFKFVKPIEIPRDTSKSVIANKPPEPFVERHDSVPALREPEIPMANETVKETRKDSVVAKTVKPAATSTSFHIVEKGETLFSISKKFKVSVDSLKSWNNMKDNSVSTGKKLRIKPKKQVVKKAAAEPTPEYHIVEKGETLFSISKKYSVKVELLKTMNNLPDNSVKTGQKLRVK